MRKVVLSIMLSSIVFGLSNMTIIAVDASEAIKKAKDKEWEKMVWAICQVESGQNDRAVNRKSSAAGRYQMLRVYVDEVNRIIGKKKYKYGDRMDPERAREMFNIYQGYYNPEKDIDKAIILHRGKKSLKYIKEVKQNMKNK